MTAINNHINELPSQVILWGGTGQAKVVRPIERTAGSIRATMRLDGHEDFILEWPLDELVTVVRGP